MSAPMVDLVSYIVILLGLAAIVVAALWMDRL